METERRKVWRQKSRYRRHILVAMWTIWYVYFFFTSDGIQPVKGMPPQRNRDTIDTHSYSSSLKWRGPVQYSGPGNQEEMRLQATGNDLTLSEDGEENLLAGYNCTTAAILDFPPDLFTQTERESGAVAIHFIASIYVFYVIALVCDDFFVPSIECICDELHLPSDVAGATFMAIATSAPELFTNVIGTFITEGDIGVGTIVGSAVFNILAVCACCGFAAHTALPLEWYPLTRDCIFYSISVILLIVVLENQEVYWYEALILVLAYAVYIIVMWKNTALKRFTERWVGKVGQMCGCCKAGLYTSRDEKTPLLGSEFSGKMQSMFADDEEDEERREDTYDEILIAKALHQEAEKAEDEEAHYGLLAFPRNEGCWTMTEWIIGWPARLVLTFTIPDCRKPKWRKFYPLTFLMCIVYIALLSYVVSWLMTIIGHTFGIPDSVMGLTFLAAGTSVPEAVSSIIVARQGLGSMSISNSIGSNTFDILMCLGLPWLIRAALIANEPEGLNFIQINSGGLGYSTVLLMVSLILLYAIIALNKFQLDKKVASIALILYAIFLVVASLLELNVFFDFNPPTCKIVGEL